jgi:beta propeller repeat protein
MSDDEESPLVEQEHWQIGEWWQYSPQAIWGDVMVGTEIEVRDHKVFRPYISTYNLRSREKQRMLELQANRMVSSVPAIHGDRVVWASVDQDIFLLDLETGEAQQITNDDNAQVYPRIFDDTIVWLDNRHGTGERYPYPSPLDVYAYDLSTGEEKRITVATTAEGYGHPAISGSIVVWTDSRHADPEVIRHASNEPDYNNEIYMYDLTTGEERRVTDYPGNDRYPAIEGNRIVWLRQSDYREADVFVYDLETGQETQVSQSSYAAFHPAIYGDHIVWTDARVSKGNTTNDVIEIVVDQNTGKEERREPGADIYLYDLKTQQEVRLTSPSIEGFSLWVSPCIHKDFIVYMLDRQIGPITYAMRLDDKRGKP